MCFSREILTSRGIFQPNLSFLNPFSKEQTASKWKWPRKNLMQTVLITILLPVVRRMMLLTGVKTFQAVMISQASMRD